MPRASEPRYCRNHDKDCNWEESDEGGGADAPAKSIRLQAVAEALLPPRSAANTPASSEYGPTPAKQVATTQPLIWGGGGGASSFQEATRTYEGEAGKEQQAGHHDVVAQAEQVAQRQKTTEVEVHGRGLLRGQEVRC